MFKKISEKNGYILKLVLRLWTPGGADVQLIYRYLICLDFKPPPIYI